MNELTKHLVDGILNEDKQEVIGIYAGGFKPPTAGHFQVVEEALKQYPEIDKLIVLVGGGVRDGIEQAESILVWEIYQNYLPMKVEIQPATKPPIGAVYSYAKNNPDDTIYWILGARDGKDEDLSDIVQRTAAIDKAEDKYNNVEVKVITTPNKDMSGTNARKALLSGNREAFTQFLPTQVKEKDEIFDILRPAVKEQISELENKEIEYWATQADIFAFLKKYPNKYKELAQKLVGKRKEALDYFWNTYFKGGEALLNEHSMGNSIDILPKLAELTQHMIDKGYNIEPLPGLELIDDDVTNAKDFFGKTAYYQPDTQTIVLYTHGRHPKDIARSYAHEMIHHTQNLEGRLEGIATTNTQEDDYLNDIEAEANLKGTMTFRNWTDSLNEIGDASAAKLEWNPAQIEKIAKEIERKIENQYEDTVEYYDMLPVINVISPESRTRYRVTVEASIDKPEDELAMTTLRVDFTTEEGGDDAINKGEQYKILATLTDIIIQLVNRVNDIDSTTLDLVKFYAKDDTEGKYSNSDSKRGKLYQAFINKNLSKLPGDWKMRTSDEVIMLSPIINEAIVGDKIECDNCDWSWKIADGGDDLFICHKCGHDNTPIDEGFDKNLGKDPFGLNQYARELAQGLEEAILTEGRYDKFVNYLSRIAFESMKDGFESGRKILDTTLTVRPPEDEPDIESDMFEFDFRVVADYTEDKYKVDGGANEGIDDDGNDITPLLIVNFNIPKNPKWSTISMDLKDVVRHELEHLTQSGDNVVGVVRDPKPELNRPGKQMADDKFIRDMIDADLLPKADYFKLEKEIDAMMQGLYFKAKKSKRPFKDVIDDYLDTQPISKEEKEVILNLWRSRRGALSLPVFENEEKVMDYKIYLDMDGVLADFDKRFEDLAGMPPRKFEDTYGKNEFWDFIDEKNKLKFWVGIPVMDGAKKLVNFASKYDYELLTAPSAKKQSRIGKILWVRNHTKDLFGTTPFINFKRAKEKHEVKPSLTKSDILVDDRDDTIQRWNAAGGTGILYTSANQVINDLKKLGL